MDRLRKHDDTLLPKTINVRVIDDESTKSLNAECGRVIVQKDS